jgi:hypothetical protein
MKILKEVLLKLEFGGYFNKPVDDCFVKAWAEGLEGLTDDNLLDVFDHLRKYGLPEDSRGNQIFKLTFDVFRKLAKTIEYEAEEEKRRFMQNRQIEPPRKELSEEEKAENRRKTALIIAECKAKMEFMRAEAYREEAERERLQKNTHTLTRS